MRALGDPKGKVEEVPEVGKWAIAYPILLMVLSVLIAVGLHIRFN